MKIRFYLPKTLFDYGLLLIIIKVLCSASQVVFYTEIMDDILTIAASILLIFHILLQQYNFKILFIYAIFTLVALYSSIQSGYSIFLVTVLMCFASRGKSLQYIVDFLLKYELIFFAIHSAYALIFFLVTGDGMFAGGGLALGFTHKNYFAVYVFNLIIMWCWLKFDDLTIKSIRKLFLLGTIIFVVSQSRTFFIEIIVLCLLLLFAHRNSNKIENILKNIVLVIVPVLSFISVGFSVLYLNGNIFAVFIDQILSSRIKLGAYALDKWGVTLLGQRTSETVAWEAAWGLTNHTFDNIYTFLAFSLGAIWIVILSILFFVLAKKNTRKDNMFLILWAVYGITEVHGLNCLLCFPILLIANLLNPELEKNTEQKTDQNKRQSFD